MKMKNSIDAVGPPLWLQVLIQRGSHFCVLQNQGLDELLCLRSHRCVSFSLMQHPEPSAPQGTHQEEGWKLLEDT